MAMQRSDHTEQVAMLHIQQNGISIERSYKYIITIDIPLSCGTIRDRGESEVD